MEVIAHVWSIERRWTQRVVPYERMGMLHPEPTASATGLEAAGVAAATDTAHASLHCTFELGTTRTTGSRTGASSKW
jgi:hypothetical protein